MYTQSSWFVLIEGKLVGGDLVENINEMRAISKSNPRKEPFIF